MEKNNFRIRLFLRHPSKIRHNVYNEINNYIVRKFSLLNNQDNHNIFTQILESDSHFAELVEKQNVPPSFSLPAPKPCLSFQPPPQNPHTFCWLHEMFILGTFISPSFISKHFGSIFGVMNPC